MTAVRRVSRLLSSATLAALAALAALVVAQSASAQSTRVEQSSEETRKWGSSLLAMIPKPNTEGLEPRVTALLESSYMSLVDVFDPSSEESALEQAETLGMAGEVFHAHAALGSAIASYRLAHERDPQNARWPYLLGVIAKGQGALEESLTLLGRGHELRPDPFTMFRIAQIYLEQGRIEEAVSVLEPLREIEGLQAATLAEMGKAALLIGDFSIAVSHFTDALEQQPEAVSLHFPLSQAHRGSGDLDLAQHHAELGGQRKVRALDPILQQVGERSVSSETYVTMGAQALRTGQAEIAGAAYSKAVELNPENYRAWMNLGVLAMEAENYANAEDLFRKALELDPEYGFAHFNLAEVLVKIDRPGDALEHLRQAVVVNPSNVEFGMAYADQLMHAENWTEAAAQYQQVAKEAPDFARPRHLQALALVALDDFDAAFGSIREAWKIDPTNVSVASALIRLASTSGSDETARAEALQVAKELFQHEQSVENGEQLAMAFAATEHFALAVQIQESITQVMQDSAAPTKILSFALENLRRYKNQTTALAPWPAGSF